MQTLACFRVEAVVTFAAFAATVAGAAPALECVYDVMALVHGGHCLKVWGSWSRRTSLSLSAGKRMTTGLGTLGKG